MDHKELVRKLDKIPYYHHDERISPAQLYTAYDRLITRGGWVAETVFSQQFGPVEIPMLCLRTKKRGDAIWGIAGIHGEEPAGPNALANRIDLLIALGEKIPVVLFPLCNPIGYLLNWRYQNEYRDPKRGESVGDSEHFLLDESGGKPRYTKPSNYEGDCFGRLAISLLQDYPARVVIDHHEDEDLKKKRRYKQMYIYSQGVRGAKDPIAIKVVELIERKGFQLTKTGITKFGEKIINGVVVSRDGSIDELLAANKIFVSGKVVEKYPARSVITVETPTHHVPIQQRIRVHETIIDHYESFFSL